MTDKNDITESKYENLVNKLAFAAHTEQRRSRRWRIFFLVLTFLYLTPVFLLTIEMGDYDLLKDNDDESSKHTALVELTGVIAAGEKASAEKIIEGLQDAFSDEDTAGVVLSINSPGGSPVQSAYIYDEIKRLREKYTEIPLYVVVEDVAASGGYFIAAAGDKIYVNKSSLVGSIGVRMDNFGFVDLLQKIGVERRLLTAGEHKGLLDPFLPENEIQKAHLQQMLNEVHQHFISAVKSARGERLKESPDLFSGLIWTGEKAITLGLVDDYGNVKSVARGVIGAENVVNFTAKDLLLDRLADRIGASFGKLFSTQILNKYLIQ